VQILDLYDSGNKIVELNAPTASGKSLDLFVLGQVLSKEYGIGKVVYSTPLVALVNQLQDNPAFCSMPVLKGRSNYPCAFLLQTSRRWHTADECPFDTWSEAMKEMWLRRPEDEGKPCSSCVYQHARLRFMKSSFGATTLARYMADPSIREVCSVLLIDESAGLEKSLIDWAALKLPVHLDLDDLNQSLNMYYHYLISVVKDLTLQIEKSKESYLNSTHGDYDAIAKLQKQRSRASGEAEKCARILAHIDHEDPFMIDTTRTFRLLEGKSVFQKLTSDLKFCVLASGTPTTDTLTDTYESVQVQHPISLERRICYYWPIGSMNFKERAETAPKIAAVIEWLHKTRQKKTMVHCGAYNVAKLIYDNLSPEASKITILQDRKDRENSKVRFLTADQAIFLSVEFTVGLDLKGPDYPLNIIAKIPFENIEDGFVKARNARDNYKRYNLHAAVSVMQAAGRCTRSLDDYSETWILDSSWNGFFNRNKRLFQPWFVAALVHRVGGDLNVPSVSPGLEA
jgi:Rad3-related DNA helicase